MKLGTLTDARVPVQVVLGETDVAVRDLLGIGEGTIIELRSLAGEPVLLYAAGEPIAKGEVVVIDENFGIRVTEILGEET